MLLEHFNLQCQLVPLIKVLLANHGLICYASGCIIVEEKTPKNAKALFNTSHSKTPGSHNLVDKKFWQRFEGLASPIRRLLTLYQQNTDRKIKFQINCL